MKREAIHRVASLKMIRRLAINIQFDNCVAQMCETENESQTDDLLCNHYVATI